MNQKALLLVFLLTSPVACEVRLPKVLGPKMVLQRNSEIKLWGWADGGEVVSVKTDWLDKDLQVTTGDNGRWELRVRTGKAGGPHRITISGENLIELNDILFGEVWLASGQSNMEMPLAHVSGAYTGISDSAKEIAESKYPQIRLFQVGNFSSDKPLDDVETGISMYGIPPAKCQWQSCSPETIPHFSSTAYFFARQLFQDLKVPIGIIDASWGGTSAEAWTPAPGLRKLQYQSDLDQAANRPQKADQKIPTRLYNGMIHPLRNYQIKGAIWYQGEGNTGRADKYHQLFSTMIAAWRDVFGYEFSFYFVQISPFNYRSINSAFLREAQLRTMSMSKTGMAVTMDIGDLRDIHPKNKQEVGRRLALWALAHDYEQKIDYSGPIYDHHIVENGKVRVQFEYAEQGLTTRDGGPPSHLEIAGSDKKFVPAKAEIEGSELLVYSEKVPNPVSVRYAFSNSAMPNLTNKSWLPASSFRTDK